MIFFFAQLLAHLNECPEELISNQFLRFDNIHVISAKNEIGIADVKKSIRITLDKYAEMKLNDASNELQPNGEQIAQNTG